MCFKRESVKEEKREEGNFYNIEMGDDIDDTDVQGQGLGLTCLVMTADLLNLF